MKTITIVVPVYNEEENIELIYDEIKIIFYNELQKYSFQILFIDNNSEDRSRDVIRELANRDERVQAIFNNTNFGFSRSSFYGLSQAEGNCAILMYADMQDPPRIIPEFVKKWEEGFKVVVGIKIRSKENHFVYILRRWYYKVLSKMAESGHIEQYDGFGLYDESFIMELRKLEDPLPYLRGIVAEIGPERACVEYTQEKRKNGQSSFNFMRYYDVAMLGITSSTKILMRIATVFGMLTSLGCVFVALVTMIWKLLNWNYYSIGIAAIIIGMFMLGGVQLFFLGLLGEYVLNINQRTMKHPIVVEKERINMKRRI